MNGARRHRARQSDQRQRAAPAKERKRRPRHRRRACNRPSAAAAAARRRAHRRRDCPAPPSRRAAARARRARRAPARIRRASAMLTRSPVTATWSGRCALRSATMRASTSPRWIRCRLRRQLMIAGRALADQLGPARRRQRRQMRVRQMREDEHGHDLARRSHELPISMPARNTSTPPTTTWNAAERNGVSM